MLNELIENNMILVLPNNMKENVIKEVSSLDKIYNIKFMSLKELIDSLTFTYDERSIYYLIKKYDMNYDVANIYLNNLKYTVNNVSDKTNKLTKIKNELIENNLLIYDKNIDKLINNKKIKIYGYDYISKFDLDILKKKGINAQIINKNVLDFNHDVYEFDDIKDEIYFVLSKIIDLLNNGVDINNIKLCNVTSEYENDIKRMFKMFLIKYAEIAIKGKNRYLFEDALVSQINHALKKADGEFLVRKEQGRIYVDTLSDYDYDEVVEALKCVFGIVGICPVVLLEDEGFDKLAEEVITYIDKVYPDKHFTFKVNARRARKNYPMESMEINAAMGEKILDAYPETKVDVHHPQVVFNIEIRAKINVYSTIIPGPGGMPVGTNGKAMLLLSGGIDSPVAGYMIAKRGVTIDATYFHAPPYTSERAKQKVVDLAKIVAKYSGPINLHVVNFTDIQLYIYEQCPHEELTIIMRRYMMKLAEHFAKENKCLGLITGESIGQVASQTMHSLAVTNEVCTMPVFRPLIGFDKQEIVDISEKIGTYETSVLPYEDCCTIFVAKHPVTKPNLNVIKCSERHLDDVIDEMMERAVSTAETIEVC